MSSNDMLYGSMSKVSDDSLFKQIVKKHPMVMKKQEVEDTIHALMTQALGSEYMTSGLQNYLIEGGFFNDPASARYHLSCKGGLARHSLNVYMQSLIISDANASGFDEKDIIVASILHDLCKMGSYKWGTRQVRNPDTGIWGPVEEWQNKGAEEISDLTGHGTKSVLRALKFIKLNDLVLESILHHMGTMEYAHNSNEKYDAISSYSLKKLPLILHMADMLSTFLIEGGVDAKSIEGLEL